MNATTLSPVGQGNYGCIQAGKPVFAGFQEMSKDPMKYNREFLMKLVQDNKDTEYGRKYHFDQIHSVEDYQRLVPVTRYDDYVEFILRETEHNEKNLLTCYPVNHYCKSSGTMGNPKRIPMSDPAIEMFNRYNSFYMKAFLKEMLGMEWIDHKELCLVESASTIATLKNGATFGALSVKMIREHKNLLKYIYSSPLEAIYPEPNTNTRYLHARFGLTTKDISCVSSSFSSFTLELLRYIKQNWELLVHDIEKGEIDSSIKMPDAVRESLMQIIKPMPERAEELRAIFSQGFDEPFMKKVWPNLQYINGVSTGGFKTYADRIRKEFAGPDIPFVKVGINASEGLFSVPVGLDREDTALVPDSIFYEFLPLDANDDFSQIVTLDQVEPGKDYELIITNLSGFYRYRMRDAVRVCSRHLNNPTIEFLYRIDQTVSIMGEKTTEYALRNAAEQTAKDLDFELIDFSVFPDMDYSPVRYQYFMETGELPKGLRPKEIRYVLEHNLAKANPSMGDKVKKEICAPTRLNIVEPETYMLYRDLMIMKGVASAQVKPVHIITNELQRKFFFGLMEYSVELVK